MSEPLQQVEVDARLTVLHDIVVLRKHGDISQASAALAINELVPALLQHLATVPDAGQPLPAWLEHEVRLLTPGLSPTT